MLVAAFKIGAEQQKKRFRASACVQSATTLQRKNESKGQRQQQAQRVAITGTAMQSPHLFKVAVVELITALPADA